MLREWYTTVAIAMIENESSIPLSYALVLPLLLFTTINVSFMDGLADDFSNLVLEIATTNSSYHGEYDLVTLSPGRWAVLNLSVPDGEYSINLLTDVEMPSPQANHSTIEISYQEHFKEDFSNVVIAYRSTKGLVKIPYTIIASSNASWAILGLEREPYDEESIEIMAVLDEFELPEQNDSLQNDTSLEEIEPLQNVSQTNQNSSLNETNLPIDANTTNVSSGNETQSELPELENNDSNTDLTNKTAPDDYGIYVDLDDVGGNFTSNDTNGTDFIYANLDSENQTKETSINVTEEWSLDDLNLSIMDSRNKLAKYTSKFLLQNITYDEGEERPESPREMLYNARLRLKGSPIRDITIFGLNVSESDNLSLRIEDVPEDIPAPVGNEWTEVYAIDPSAMDFSVATVTVVAKANALYKCASWDFNSSSCPGDWVLIRDDLVPGEEYTIRITPDDPGFGEANISVINVQSYPVIGENWTVSFTTEGTANLTIKGVDGTSWSDSNNNGDLRFLEILCGSTPVPYQWINGSVFLEDYSCPETSYEKSRVITPGKHHLEFRFGDDIEYAHNQAGMRVILLRGAGGDINTTTDTDITWSTEDRKDANIFSHSTSSNQHIITVNQSGVYRVSYGLYVTTTGGGRYSLLSHVEVDGTDSEACYASGYNRGGTSSQDLVATSECLLNLTSGQNVSVVAKRNSTDAGQGPALTAAQSWFHMQRVRNHSVIMLKESGGGDAFDAADVNVAWDTEDAEDSLFSHGAGSSEIQVLQDGFYRLTYGITVDKDDNDRASAFGKVQIKPDGGSFADVPYGWSHTNQRGAAELIRVSALSASTVLNLSANDSVQVVVGRASAVDPGVQSLFGGKMHLDMEYLGNETYANVMMVYDSAGGDDLDPGPVDQTWDTEDWQGSHFNYTPTGSEITVLESGVYHISYGIYTTRTAGGTRFERVSSLRINDAIQNVCYGSSYNRGDQGTYDSYTGGTESSCYIELAANDRIEIRSTKTSSGTDQTVPTDGDRIYLTIESMDHVEPLPPEIVLNAPANNSNHSAVGTIILNATASDPNNDSMAVEIFAGNSSPISIAHGLVYQTTGIYNGTDVTYNITALPFVPGSNTELLLHFDNRSDYGENSTLAYDFSGTGNNATCAGSACPTFNMTGGRFAGAFELDGTDDYWDIDNNYFDSAVDNRTVELWFRANDAGTATNQFIYDEGGNVNGFGIYLRNGHVYVGAWVEGNGWDGSWLNHSTTSDEWHYVALIFEGNDHMTMVYDGDETTISVPTTMAAHGGDDFIGRMGTSSKTDQGDQTGGPTFYFNGTIDEFAIYDRVLSYEEAYNHYTLPDGTYYWNGNATAAPDEKESETWLFNINSSMLVNLSINDTSDTPVNITLALTDRYGAVQYNQTGLTHSTYVESGNYEILVTPVDHTIKEMNFSEFEITSNLTELVAIGQNNGSENFSFSINPLVNFTNLTVTANGTSLPAGADGFRILNKCTDWNFTNSSCNDGNWTGVAALLSDDTFEFEINSTDPGFAEGVSDCIAEDFAASGTFGGVCDGTYPAACGPGGDLLGCDDNNLETHSAYSIFGTQTYGGVQIQQYDTAVTDCLNITNVDICYEWWRDTGTGANCDISVDADGGANWTIVNSTCPGTSANPGLICTNVTALENWSCSSFFGTNGTRARAKSEATMTGFFAISTYSWDLLYFNVTYDAPTVSITNISDAPDPQGYGLNVTISANVTNASTVWVGVTPSGGTETNYTMTNISADLYLYNYTGWINGTHNYTIYANDSAGNNFSSSVYNFTLNQNITIQVKTMNDSYTTNQTINVTDPPNIWMGPEILSATVSPEKVVPGDLMTVTVYVRDDSGIVNATAYMPHELGTDVLELSLVSGNDTDGLWQGEWVVHDTIAKDYITLVVVESFDGDISEAEIHWFDPPGVWISPNNWLDPTNQWDNEANASDGDTDTYAADNSNPGGGWGDYIIYNTTQIESTSVRVWADYDVQVSAVDIDIYRDGAWVDVHEGPIPNLAWYQVNFTQGNVSAARYRYNYTVGGWIYWLYELQFYNVTTQVNIPVVATRAASSVEETSGILHGVINADGGTDCQVRFLYGTTTAYGNSTSWVGPRYTGDSFAHRLSGLTNGQTYHFLAQINNSAGMANGSDMSFTATPTKMGWVSATGHDDPNSEWENEENAYDDELVTEAQSFHTSGDADGIWSFYLYMNRSPTILSDKIRFNAKSIDVDLAEVDVYINGSWVNVYNATFPDKTYVVATFNQSNVSQARIRFSAEDNGEGFYWQLYEFDFYKITLTAFENQSRMDNNGTTNASCYLQMKTQYLNGSTWIDDDIVVNDSTPRVLAPSELLKLDSVWNPTNYTTNNLSFGDGTYRIYAACLDNESNILMNIDGTYVNTTYNFTYDTVPPFVNITSPANNSNYTVGSTVPIAVNATDANGVSSVYVNVSNSLGYEMVALAYNATSGLWEGSYSNTFYLDNYSVQAIATDNSGSVNDTEFVYFFTTDISVPNVTLVAPPDGNYTENGTVTFTCNVTDNYDVTNVSLYITDENNQSFSFNQSANVSGVSVSVDFNLSLTTGFYTWNCLAYDYSGNSDWGDDNYTIRVLDLTGCPVIPYPGIYSQPVNYAGAPNNASPLSDSACVKITSSDVTFDCAGYNITDNGTAGTTYGVLLNGSLTNVTLRNCNISNYTDGIYIYQSNDSSFANNSISSNTNGMVFDGSTNNSVQNSTSESNSGYGILLNQSDGNSINDTNSTNNAADGIYFDAQSDGNSLYSGYICYNGFDVDDQGSNSGALDTCDTFAGWNENGHLGCEYTCSDFWHRFFGNVNGSVILTDSVGANNVYSWNASAFQLYFVDVDSNISWGDLQAIGRNTSNQTSGNDFTELDTAFSGTPYPDNINATYSTDGTNPIITNNYTVFQNLINYVPVANSTKQNTTFQTGILWDTNDGGTEYSNAINQSTVWVVSVNTSTADAYGTYDYLIQVPYTLSDYEGSNGEVAIWMELQ